MPHLETEENLDSDFTSARYEYVCKTYLKDADCRIFTEEVRAQSIFLRHDVDVSLNRAKALAQIEHSQGIRATYFVDPFSAHYSIFERGQKEKLEELVSLGHSIGLHFDASRCNPVSFSELETHVKFESQVLERAGVKPVAISFHNPRPRDLEFSNSKIAGLVNAYSRELYQEINYVSDSNGYWRFDSLEKLLRDRSEADSAIQILIHPEWWQDGAMPPRSRFFRSLFGRSAHQIKIYDESLRKAGRSNISGLPEALEALIFSDYDNFRDLDVLWNLGMYSEIHNLLVRLLDQALIEFWLAKAVHEWRIYSSVFEQFVREASHEINTVTMLRITRGFIPTESLSDEEMEILFGHLSKVNSLSRFPNLVRASESDINVATKALDAILKLKTQSFDKLANRTFGSQPPPGERETQGHSDCNSSEWNRFKREVSKQSSLSN